MPSCAPHVRKQLVCYLLAWIALLAAAIPTVAQDAATQRTEETATEIIIVSLGSDPGPRLRREVSRLAGGAHRVPLKATNSEIWTVPRSKVHSVVGKIQALGLTATSLQPGWDQVLTQHHGALPPGRNKMLENMRASRGTVAVRVMEMPSAPLAAFALMHGGDDRTGDRNGSEAPIILIAINETQSITVRRTRHSCAPVGCTWFGVVEETGEAALLMWWKAGQITGMLSYRARIYTVLSMGDGLHAVVEVDPKRMPPDHSVMRLSDRPSAVQKPASLEALESSLAPRIEIAPLSLAERQARATRPITIDIMIIYTRRIASRYIREPEYFIALAVEQANEAFRNSGLAHVALRLVHTQVIDYDESNGQHFEHLYRMVDGKDAFKDLRRVRDDKHADIVGLVLDELNRPGFVGGSNS